MRTGEVRDYITSIEQLNVSQSADVRVNKICLIREKLLNITNV